MVSGNHEAYEYPYGISPRIPVVGKVNEGIPLDHNLTIYEAILLYGPGYSDLPKPLNFSSSNFEWFYNIFTPFADYWQTFGEQCLIGLQWGDDEDFLGSKARRGGTLPRATKSLDAAQISLVNTALAQNREAILCTHFTIVNYDLSSPLAEEGEVNIGSVHFSKYDHGSSTGDRERLYDRIINHANLKLCLSGHSHRVGLYTFEPEYVTYHMEGRVGGLAPLSRQVISGGKTKGVHPADPQAKYFAGRGQARLLVSASTGPIPKQNVAGEMSGQGMEIPSGSMIDEKGHITLIKSREKTAKPRFCVACDYIDIMGGGFWEYFRAAGEDGTFEMKPYWEKIHPNLSQSIKEQLIESVTLYLVGGDGASPIKAEKEVSQAPPFIAGILRWKFESDLQSEIEFYGKNTPTMFISIRFKSEVFNDRLGFNDYDFQSSWNIQVGIYKQSWFINKEVEISNNNLDSSKWHIVRHKKDGEVPSFLWRSGLSIEYDNSLDVPK